MEKGERATPWFLVISLLLISMSPVLSMQAAKETSFRPDTSDSIVSTIDLSSYFKDYEGTFVLYDLQKIITKFIIPNRHTKEFPRILPTNSIVLCSDWKKKSLLQKIP